MRFQYLSVVDFAVTAAGSGSFAFSYNWPVGGLSQVVLGFAGVNCEECDATITQVSAYIAPRFVGGASNSPQSLVAVTSGDAGGASSAFNAIGVFNNFKDWNQDILFNVPSSGALFTIGGFVNAPTLVDAVICKFTFGFNAADGKVLGDMQQFQGAERLKKQVLKPKFLYDRK